MAKQAEYRPIIQKYPYIRSKVLTRSAEGEVCTMGFPGCTRDANTTVWAHANYDFTGKGAGIKSSDQYGAYMCMACHDLYDGRRSVPGMTEEGKDWYFWRAMVRSWNRLIESGVITVKGA